MSSKSTALFALLIPGLAMLAACDRVTGPDKDDVAATAPVAAPPAPEPAMPAATMPADNMPAAAAMAGNEMAYADMDKNHDGNLMKDELAETDMLYQHFSVADTDGNGKLSEAEVMKHRADMAAGK